MKKRRIKDIIIMNEITQGCENCGVREHCLEEKCTLWRIEQIVLNDNITEADLPIEED